jgi:hypothetical protein
MKLMTASVTILLVLLVAAPASAETKAETEARALFREGNRRLDAADYVTALDLFRTAYARHASPKILLNIGTTLMHLGRFAEAADTYERYQRHPGADPKQSAKVDQELRDLATKVGKLRITVNEPGARVLVDGKPVGESPGAITLRLDPGSHSIMAEKDGYPTAATTVSLSGGQERALELRLVRASSAEAGKPRTSSVVPPVPSPRLAEGSSPPPAVTTAETPRPRDAAWRPPLYVAWIALGVAAVGAGTGGYFGSRALDRGVSADDSRGPALGATVCFSVAGVAAAVAGGVLLWRALTPRKARKLEAGIGPGALILAGRF